MDFKDRYLELKREGKTDKEISTTMFISISTLKRNKKKYGIQALRKPMKNKQGVTEEQLRQAEKIGLDRHLVLMRIRNYGWTIEKALHLPEIPLNRRRMNDDKSTSKRNT